MYRKIGPFVDGFYEAVQQWCHRLAEPLEPDCKRRLVVAVDETKVFVDAEERYARATIVVDTFEAIHAEVSAGYSNLDALLFLKQVLTWCRGQPPFNVERGCDRNSRLRNFRLNMTGNMGRLHLVETCLGVLKYRSVQFWDRFLTKSSIRSLDRWVRTFAALYNALL